MQKGEVTVKSEVRLRSPVMISRGHCQAQVDLWHNSGFLNCQVLTIVSLDTKNSLMSSRMNLNLQSHFQFLLKTNLSNQNTKVWYIKCTFFSAGFLTPFVTPKCSRPTVVTKNICCSIMCSLRGYSDWEKTNSAAHCSVSELLTFPSSIISIQCFKKSLWVTILCIKGPA